jgi:Ras-related protein Rab-1A
MECISLPKSVKVSEEENVEVVVPVLQTPVEKTDESEKCEEEAESNLQSLLCEETIPGSPAPASDSTQAIETCSDETEERKATVLEMPFASAPGSNCTSSSSNGKSSATVPIFVSPPIVDPPAATVPLTVDLSAAVQMQTVTTAAASTISPPLPPPQVQVQPPAGPGPGSGIQGPGPGVSKRNSNEAAPVMDNTPPTTPDSSLSTISGSPRE